MAVDLLKKKASSQGAVSSLVAHCGVSARQAYRYVQRAQESSKPLPLPEAKDVFTVKLPVGLIDRVRQRAHREEQAISDLVAEALEDFLKKRRSHG